MESLAFAPLLLILVILGGFIVLYVFYLKNLQDLLKEVSDHNRQVPAVNVWLMFIPLFNIVYPFILYPKISESVRLEFEERGEYQDGDYGKGLGITLGALGAVGILPIPQMIKSLIGLGNLVILIVFWVKMAEFKNRLRSIPKGDGVRLSGRADLLD